MSTGNNKDDTIVSKKRKRILPGYIHPNKPEIKKFDFFDGGPADQGSYRVHYARDFLPLLVPTTSPLGSYGCYKLVQMTDPLQGSASYQRVGQKYFLKYIKFKGHIAIGLTLPFTLRYKLILIKSDWVFNSSDDFFGKCFSNYQPLAAAATYEQIEFYCRHNFYKTYQWKLGMSETRTSVMVVSSGSLSPADYISRPTKSSTLGSSPSWTYTFPETVSFATANSELQQISYLPLNVSVQVNDNVQVGVTHFYLMLMTDHGIGVAFPENVSGSQLFYRASNDISKTVARFNFFGCSYFTDL